MFEFFSVDLDHVIDKACIFLVSGVYLSVVEIGVFVKNVSFNGLSVFVILLLESGAASAGVVEQDDVNSVSTSVLVESTFKDVEKRLAVVMSQGIYC